MSDKDYYSPFTKELMERAEAMSARISASVGLDRRGGAAEAQGVLSDLDVGASGLRKVLVAVAPENDWLTLVTDSPLPACDRALLVYRPKTGPDVRLLGHNEQSRSGQRREDGRPDSRHYARFFSPDKPSGSGASQE